MSTPSPFGGRSGRAAPTLPKGDTVASYETYAEAQAAVDRLAKAEFPVKELSIVGTDLTSVERITGTLSWGRAAGAGALSGAWFGTFLGLLFFLFSPTGTSLGILAAAVLIGAAFGMIFSIVSYSINRRRRDFTSTMQVLATRYAVIAESPNVARAREVLGAAGDGVRTAAARVPDSAPTVEREADDTAVAPSTESSPSDDTTPSPTADDAPPARTYGEAQDAARRAQRERAADAARGRGPSE